LTRTVVAHMIVTLDGVAQFDAVQGAIMELIDEQVAGEAASKIAEEDAMILGRKTYEEWVHFLARFGNRSLCEPHQHGSQVCGVPHGEVGQLAHEG
jgi:hypothetical protein